MATCNYGCDETLENYEETTCGFSVPGGVNKAILLECNSGITKDSDASAINAAIAAQTAHVVTNASFSIDAATPVVLTSKVACTPDSVTNYTRTGTYYNPNVTKNNAEYHSTLFKGKKLGGIILYECAANESEIAEQCTFIDAVITFTGSRILPSLDNEEQRFEGTFNWKSLSEPAIIDTPLGVTGFTD